jgi:hypothetical protein
MPAGFLHNCLFGSLLRDGRILDRLHIRKKAPWYERRFTNFRYCKPVLRVVKCFYGAAEVLIDFQWMIQSSSRLMKQSLQSMGRMRSGGMPTSRWRCVLRSRSRFAPRNMAPFFGQELMKQPRIKTKQW